MKMSSQKAHLWAENYTTAIQFCQELFSKNFLAYLPPESQKEKAPRGEPSPTYENCSIC